MNKLILLLTLIMMPFFSSAKNLNSYINEAERGHSDSALKLGMMYEFGMEKQVNRDISKAVYYYTIAAEEKNYRAIARLGVISYNKAEYKKAIEYFKLAARNGESLSEAYLGKIIEEQSQNKSEAVRFYESSIKKNNPLGKMFLGEYLVKTKKKGSRDFIRGFALLVSASKVNEDAKRIIKRYPYKFNKEEQVMLKEEFNKIK